MQCELRHDDQGLMQQFLAGIEAQLPPPTHYPQWLHGKALTRFRDKLSSIDNTQDLAFEFASLAGSFHYWPLAIRFLKVSLDQAGQCSSTHYNLAIAHWQLAAHQQAVWHLSQAVALAPGNPRFQQKLKKLQAWFTHCSTVLGDEIYRPLSWRSEYALYSTLLGDHHAVALHRQQSNPDIARFVRVDQLNSVAEARQWIKRQNSNPNKTTLVILHPSFGLIGLVALECAGNAALFYYWIGVEFQNQGFGQQALELLCCFAKLKGVSHLFSSVYDMNQSSLRVLRKAGFQPLPYRCGLEDTPYGYFHLPLNPSHLPESESHALAILQRLLDFIHATN
jgi:RimJ/RimL family protein N-acetyltransferase